MNVQRWMLMCLLSGLSFFGMEGSFSVSGSDDRRKSALPKEASRFLDIIVQKVKTVYGQEKAYDEKYDTQKNKEDDEQVFNAYLVKLSEDLKTARIEVEIEGRDKLWLFRTEYKQRKADAFYPYGAKESLTDFQLGKLRDRFDKVEAAFEEAGKSLTVADDAYNKSGGKNGNVSGHGSFFTILKKNYGWGIAMLLAAAVAWKYHKDDKKKSTAVK